MMNDDRDPEGDWRLYGFVLVVHAVGVPRELWRRAKRRVRRAVGHALCEAFRLADPESVPDLSRAGQWTTVGVGSTDHT